MIAGLAPLYLALSALLVLWNLLVAGRAASSPGVARPVAALSALGALLIAPALIVAIATTSFVYGRALDTVRWVWPLTAGIIAAQAILVAASRTITPLITLPIVAYDAVVALAATVRYADGRFEHLPDWLLGVSGAQAATLALVGGSQALVSAAYLNIPMLAPAVRPRWRASGAARYLAAGYAAIWAGGFAWGIVRGERAVSDYRQYDRAPLHERDEREFAIGLHILPGLSRPPYPVALARDLRLADTLGVRAVSITILPSGATRRTLDSLARALDPLRRDGVLVLVRLGYHFRPRLGAGTDSPVLGAARRGAALEIARRLRPDVLFPAPEPYAEGLRAAGWLPPATWGEFIAETRAAIHAERPATAVGMLLTGAGAADSTMYAWAAADTGGVDAIGLTVTPSSRGPAGLDERTATFDRWMAAAPTAKPHWIYVSGAPAAHGERNQARAIWAGLAWATGLGKARGAIVLEAGDYGALRGLRRVDGELRPAARTLERAIRALRETGQPQ